MSLSAPLTTPKSDMPHTYYGQADPDPTLLNLVETRLSELGISATMIVLHQRMPIDARPCRHPGSLTYDVVIEGRARRAHQALNGQITLDF